MQFIITICMTLFTLSAFSQSYEYQGIYYNLFPEAKEAEVTSHPNKYEGTIQIPSKVFNDYTVTAIGERAFEDCPELFDVYIPSSVKIIKDYAFCLSGVNLRNVYMQDGITSIGKRAFYGCTSLTEIILPKTITTIADYAFGDCNNLASIVIPDTQVSLGDYVFIYSESLKNIYCYADCLPQTQPNTFNGIDITTVILHVPESSLNLYQSSTPWNQFKKIVTLTTAIHNPAIDNPLNVTAGYSINGIKNQHTLNGINIITFNDRKKRKVLVKKQK